MKNVVILHGTDANSKENWFPWLKKQLEEKGYDVWVPDLPKANKPNIKRYNEFILKKKHWTPNDETILIGHSSGAVAVLGLLQALPENVKIKKAILVSPFVNNLGWESLNELFDPAVDYAKIKPKAKEFVILHSSNDPYIPQAQAEEISKGLHTTLRIEKNQGHFAISSDPKYKEFPLLLDLIKD
jgi:uncharacterized protein